MFDTDMDSKDRIIKSKIDLNRDRPFFAYILMNMNVEQTEPTEKVPTMGVNQLGDLFWNDKFVTELADDELQGVLAHEVMHIATLTFQREGNRNKMLWNMATDIVINNILLGENFALPKDCLLTTDGGAFFCFCFFPAAALDDGDLEVLRFLFSWLVGTARSSALSAFLVSAPSVSPAASCCS